MALLHLLMGLREVCGIDLAVAHLDHMIRGKRSKADADFVKRFCSKNGIYFISERIDVKRSAKADKLSLEEGARKVRYAFYERAVMKARANKIATGHTIDDQAETVLMRLAKGTGSRGLSGIPYKRSSGKIWVIRPLLDIRRRDIEKYLKKRKVPSRIDASNLKTFYLRNKIRHILMPVLEKKFNPNMKENLSFIAKISSGDFDYINNIARRKSKDLAKAAKDSIAIKISSLSRQHIALQRLIVRNMIERLKGDLRKIAYKHWQGISAMLSDDDKTHLELPGRINVAKKKGHIIFSKAASAQRRIKKSRKTGRLDIPGELHMPELGVKVSSEVAGRIPKFKKGNKRKRVEYINGDVVSAPLRIRTWRNGDRMRPLGMKTSKKLHDIFIDDKVPREIRDRVPLVLSGNRILWAAGLKLSDHCRIVRGTKKIVRLSISPLVKK